MKTAAVIAWADDVSKDLALLAIRHRELLTLLRQYRVDSARISKKMRSSMERVKEGLYEDERAETSDLDSVLEPMDEISSLEDAVNDEVGGAVDTMKSYESTLKETIAQVAAVAVAAQRVVERIARRSGGARARSGAAVASRSRPAKGWPKVSGQRGWPAR